MGRRSLDPDRPGPMLGRLRERLPLPGQLFDRRTVRRDAAAGIVLGVECVPDGLASGLLAGRQPGRRPLRLPLRHGRWRAVHRHRSMAVQATGAMAIIVADVDLNSYDDPARALVDAVAC